MRLAAAILAAATLAGCDEATPDAQPSGAMAIEAARSDTGTGTVTAVDAEAGAVTIDHAPMPGIGWSAMTMTFEADPALLEGVAEGDTVAFDVTVRGSAGTITALTAK